APAQALSLRTLVTPTAHGIASRVLARTSGGNVTLFALDAGQGLEEHTSPFDALVLVLEGALTLTIGGGAVAASPGPALAAPRGGRAGAGADAAGDAARAEDGGRPSLAGLDPREQGVALLGLERPVHGGIEDPLLLQVVPAQHAVQVLTEHGRVAVARQGPPERLEDRLDLPVLGAHHRGRPGLGQHAEGFLQRREHNLLLDADVPHQADDELS